MEKNDSISLLKECDAGSKMAVASIEEVLEKVQASELKKLLSETKDHHEQLGNEIHKQLLEHGSEEKDPNPFAKSMSYLKTNMKMGMDASDATIADILTDGCDMGIKSLYKYMNQYPAAGHTARNLCEKLISIEESLRRDMHAYL